MATLVLSTVGTILGGPVGGAIGSLLGQSIDQQLFGPGPRHGPRVGDLAVQSSSYGTPIPRLFGTIRVAGSIVWATDLKEDSQTQGAKGQPDSVIYSYSVSFAVALSCREVSKVKRIWADGKLLRGASGDFKVSTGFRFHRGGESQSVDPLIGSVEGPDSAPAYRGVALAVFENLQLAEYGNRIPFLTFEVEADAVTPAVGDVLRGASDGAIDCSAAAPLPGYAAYGATVEAAVQPLVEHFGIELFDDGETLRSPTAGLVYVSEDELGASASPEPMPKTQRTQAAAGSLPSVLSLNYYDAARDYQAGQMRASTGGGAGVVRADQLAAVLTADSARALAESSLARRWAQRDRLVLRLMPNRLDLEPGMTVTTAEDGQAWSAVRVTNDGMAVIVELQPVVAALQDLPADEGRSLHAADVMAAPTTLALVELPDSGAGPAGTPVVVLASTSPELGARSVPVDLEIGGAARGTLTARRRTIAGQTLTALAPGQSALLDLQGAVEVELVNVEHWLQSCSDDALAAGENLAMIGRELLQFGSAVPLGNGRFRLSRLLRGRRGTEWAAAAHQAGDAFVLIDEQSLVRLDVAYSQVGTTVGVTPRGLADGQAAAVTLVVSGEALRPPSPVHLSATRGAGGLHCQWCRRSALGWGWVDAVDAPLGSSRELYRVRLQSSSGTIDVEASSPEASFADQDVAALGAGPLELSVIQVGDLAVSHPALLSIEQEQPNGP